MDGIRSIVLNSGPATRTLKPIPNKYVRAMLNDIRLLDMDGELMGSQITGKEAFSKAGTAIMTHEGNPDFSFHVFDVVTFDDKIPWLERYSALGEKYERLKSEMPFLHLVPHFICNNEEELDAGYDKFLDMGYEGLMWRKVDGPYKMGRSTTNEGILLKYKPYEDSEAEIMGFEEMMHNANPAVRNLLGRTERSSLRENLVGLGTLGTLICRDLVSEEVIRIGTGVGLTRELRQHIWNNKRRFLSKIIRYSFSPSTKDLPRQAVMQGFRHEDDI